MSNFWKHSLSVFGGTAAAQAIPILASLLITRLFAPDSFGAFSTWLAIASFLSVLLCLGLENTLTLEKEGLQRQQAVSYYVSIAMGMSAVGYAILLILLAANIHIAKLPTELILTLIPGALSIILVQLWQTWAAANGQFGLLNKIRLLQAGNIALLQIVAGFISSSATGLTIAYLSGNLLALMFACYHLPCSLNFKKNRSHIIGFIKKYQNFPKFALPAASLNTATANLPVVVIGARFGPEYAGYVALTFRVLGAPIALVGKALLDIFKRYASVEFHQTGGCRKAYLQTLSTLLIASIIFTICTILFGEKIFALAFGQKWAFSGEIAIWLLPLFTMRFIAGPLSYTVYIFEKQKIDLCWQIALFGCTTAILLTLTPFKNMLVIYSSTYALMYVVYLYMSFTFSKGKR